MFSALRGRMAERADPPTDLVGHRHVKLWPWYAPWGRQIDLPDGLPFESVFGLLFGHLCCIRQLLDGCEPLPVASGAVV